MICPGCGAPAAAHDVLHHFLCAYVGPDYDFFETGKDHFSCPKCLRPLLREGDDWEKIGRSLSCSDCGSEIPLQDEQGRADD